MVPYSEVVRRAAQDARLRAWPEHTLRDEANAIAAYAFRNTYLEDLHAAGRITDHEMKRLIIQCSASLAHWLFLRDRCAKTFPKRYYAEVEEQARYSRNWERTELDWEVPESDYVSCLGCQRDIPIHAWRFCPNCGTKSRAPGTDASSADPPEAAHRTEHRALEGHGPLDESTESR
ncbi:MAG: hypothetical protein ACHREM_05040 [Polyangiales bacterium]